MRPNKRWNSQAIAAMLWSTGNEEMRHAFRHGNMSLIDELRRRNVLRVATAFAIVAWAFVLTPDGPRRYVAMQAGE